MGRRARGSSAAVEDHVPEASMSGAELLDISPYNGDIDADLAAVPKKAKVPGPTLYLTAAVVALVGFLGGIQADKTWGSTSSSSGALPSGARTGLGTRPGGSGFGTAGGAATTGTVQKIVGNTIYLKTASGTTVKVTTGGSTKVSVAKTAKASDLKSGTTVVVQGSTGSDGTITATTVTQGSGMTSGSGAPSGGGAGGPG